MSVTVNLIGAGAYDHFININGETIFDDSYGSVTCSHGDTIYFMLTGTVVLDSDVVFDATGYGVQEYSWEIPSDVQEITIEFFNEDGYSSFYVDTVRAAAPVPTGPHRTRVDAVIWGVPSSRCLVDGVGYSVEKGRTLVNGVGYDVEFTPPSIPVSDLAVGESVYANVGGVRTEFLVVQKGKPNSSYYDASCDGTWLLMKNVYTTIINKLTGNYSESTLHSYLNGTFLDLLDADVANAIKTVKIPYNTGIYKNIQTGSNGLSTKAFALSIYEVGFTSSMNTEFVDYAACLSYFSGTAYTDSKRIGYLNGVATDYALRTTHRASSSYLWGVSKTGIYATLQNNTSHGVRPAFILNSDTLIHADTFDILG